MVPGGSCWAGARDWPRRPGYLVVRPIGRVGLGQRGGHHMPPAHTLTMTTASTTRSARRGGSPATDRTAFLDAVSERIPDLRVLTDAVDRESYRHDETAYQTAGLPLAVALPTETA